MRKRLLFVCFVLALLGTPNGVYAQFTDPHTYDNAPVGTNQLELAYAYARSNSSIDTSIIVTGARLNLNQGSIGYTRYFGLFNHLFWVKASLPIAGLNGSISGTSIQGSNAGTGDTSYQITALLKGGPALSVAQFENYKPTTTVGMSLTITAPTGLYHSNKVLNLGSDRWSFKPEFAVAHSFGPEQKWEVEGYANAYFFTDNTSYHGVEILRQDPLPGVEGHISYSFFNSLWVSLDTRYSLRGITFVDGVNQNNSQQNFSLGSELNISFNARNSVVFVFDKALVHQNGPASSGFAVKYNFSWGKGD
jgi:hypothetical protein